jgi:radical SAM-linked protein
MNALPQIAEKNAAIVELTKEMLGVYVEVYKILCKYTKTGNLKFISHLDILRLMQRAICRAKIPAKYSEGFNPHMKLAFGFPLSLGIESIGEYFELELTEKLDIEKIVDSLNNTLPNKIRILEAKYSEGKESLMSISNYAEYLIDIESNNIDIEYLSDLLSKMTKEGLIYTKEKMNKKNKLIKKEINTKDFIHYASAKKINKDNKVESEVPQRAKLEIVFKTSGEGSMKVDDFIKLIEENGLNIEYYSVMKIEALDVNLKPIL